MMAEGTFELHPGDALYPETVLELSDVPQTLYVRGNPEVLSTPALSIIGARKASPYGLAVAELAAKVAVEAGVTVVSGGAVGCDQASGWAAVNAGGKHVVVLGTGADVVYPRSSAGLITRTLDTGGAVVSISPWGHGSAQVCLSAPQSRDRGPVASPLCIRGGYAFRDVFYSRGCYGFGARTSCRAGVDPVARVAWHELPHCERCLLHHRRGIY